MLSAFSQSLPSPSLFGFLRGEPDVEGERGLAFGARFKVSSLGFFFLASSLPMPIALFLLGASIAGLSSSDFSGFERGIFDFLLETSLGH